MTDTASQRPAYDQRAASMLVTRSPMAQAFASQALATSAPFLGGRDFATLRVLDVGCGYGATTAALAERCAFATGLEPSRELAIAAQGLANDRKNLVIHHADFTTWDTTDTFDLIILDNVYEHIPDHVTLARQLERYLAPNGVVYIVVPNKLWPIEVHYRLPFLSYLPLPLANWYLRVARRGTDYRDASYAPTYWEIKRNLSSGSLHPRFVLPADLSLTETGASPLYRTGAFLLERIPALWPISKAFVVICTKS